MRSVVPEQTMGGSEDSQNRSRTWSASFLAFVAVYVLSPGPVSWLFRHDYLPQSLAEHLVRTVYAPLAWMYDNWDLYEKYVDWWT